MGSTFEDLATKCSVVGLRDVYQLIYERQRDRAVQDAATPIRHTASDLRFIRDVMHQEVQAGYARDSVPFQTVAEVRRGETQRVARSLVRMTRDGFFNPASGVGTGFDTGMFNTSFVPISMAPEEASAIYSSGGIGQIVIDKKAKGVLLNGYRFKGSGWTDSELGQMKDHAEKRGLTMAASDGMRDALTFGGAVLYPHFKNDTPITYDMSMDALIKGGVLVKDCIDRYVSTDRWNCVFVPHWDVTADDYMTPSHYYIPIGGIRVATERSAIIRPKKLPFWAAIRQIGWGISDIEGWLRSMFGYETMLETLPTLFQQMSLLFQSIPLDAALMQNGAEEIEEIIRATEARMKTWSAIKPKLLGIAGEPKVVERHYENMDQLIILSRQDFGAKAGIPESVIWPSQPTGMADSREEDVQLKQSETIKRTQIEVAPAFRTQAQIVAISTFGPTKEVLARLNTLEMSFEAPAIQSAKERAESLEKFTDGVSKLVAATCPLDVAFDVALEFMSDVHLPKKVLDRLRQDVEEIEGEDYTPLDAIEAVIEKARSAAGSEPAIENLRLLADKVDKMTGGNRHLRLLESTAEKAREVAG